MKSKKSLLLVLFIFGFAVLNAKPKKVNSLTKADAGKKPSDRPSVALVLSGGGAKGFAELPIMEYIEQMDIPIDMIIGTSVGSIIGGFYAAGYTAEGVVEEFSKVDWSLIFDDTTESPYEDVYGIHGSNETPLSIGFGTNLSLKIGSGLSKGQYALSLLKSLLVKIPSDIHFNDLTIPFRAVATDMNTGDAYVLDDGDLAEAIRSSMSLPGVFSPMYIDEFCFMDGGLRYNLAINVAKNMGYDIIIAIDIAEPVLNNPEGFTADPAAAILNTIGIAQYTVTEQFKDYAAIIVTPDVKDFGILDFQRSQEIYDEGKKALEKYKDSFEKIRQSIYPDDYDANGNRKSSLSAEKKESIYETYRDLVPETIEIEGAYSRDIGDIKKYFKKIQNKPVTQESFLYFAQKVYQTGNYKSVRPRIVQRDGVDVMKLQLVQEDPKELRILVGTDFQMAATTTKTLTMDLELDAQVRGFTGRGSLLSLHGIFLTDLGGEFYFLQPVGANFFVDGKVGYIEDKYTRSGDNINHYSSEETFNTFTSAINVGLKTLKGNIIKIGGFYKFVNNSLLNYSSDPMATDMILKAWNYDTDDINMKVFQRYFGVSGCFDVSKIDSLVFATKGFTLSSRLNFIIPINRITESLDVPSLVEKLEFKGVIPMGSNFSFSFSGLAGTNFLNNFSNSFAIISEEGFSNYDRVYFPSITSKRYYGSNIAATALALQFKPFDHLTIFGGDLYFRIDGTAGIVNYDWSESFSEFTNPETPYPIVWSGTVGVGVKIKSTFGAYLRLGVCSNRDAKVAPLFCLDIGSFNF